MMAAQTTFIDNWLDQPHRLSETEQQKLSVLLERHPYLVPAQWMRSSEQFAQEGFSQNMMQHSQLFMGNWMHFYNAIRSANGQIENAATAIIREGIAQEESIEEILDIEEGLILDESMMQEKKELDEWIQPVFTDNYFQHQGIEVSDAIPEKADEEEYEKSLLVMMGFDEWLLFLKKKNEAKKSEEEDKAMLRSMWQREKLAAAMGEEDDNIPEAVFEMAINSIDKQDIMVSEPLAEIHVKQGRYDKAIEIYRKLSLQNPEKKTYFAAKINHLNKENLS